MSKDLQEVMLRDAKGRLHHCMIELSIDWTALRHQLGSKALANKTRRSKAMHGAIAAKVINAEEVR
jgi:hypothetical protein